MSDNVRDFTLEVLKQIQAGFTDIRQRLDTLEEIARKQRRDSAGMLVMMRATAGDFDQRVSDVEERMTALEARKS